MHEARALYVRFDPAEVPETAAQLQGQLLEKGRWWKVYCIDERGCAERTITAL